MSSVLTLAKMLAARAVFFIVMMVQSSGTKYGASELSRYQFRLITVVGGETALSQLFKPSLRRMYGMELSLVRESSDADGAFAKHID